MSMNLGYTRKFLILKQDYSNMQGLSPKGHGRMEVRGARGNIYLTLEKAEPNNYYNIILLGGNNNYHEIGKIYTEDNGSGKGEFGLNYKELGSLGFSMDKINGILVMRDSDILLGGYLNKGDNTIENFIRTMEKKEEETIIETYIEEEPIIEEIIEDPVIQQEPTIEEPIVLEEPVIIEEADIVEEEIAILEETVVEDPPFDQELFEQDLKEIFQPQEEPIQAEHPAYEDESLNQERKTNKRDQTTSYILNILSFFPYINPFKLDLEGYNWWKIDVQDPTEDIGFLPYFSYITGGTQKYPMVENSVTANQLMKRHKHYLFGLYNVEEEVKFYVYGIPGKFTIEEHPERGITGFNTWYEEHGEEGYWLLFIDPLAGSVIYPINPMIPIK